MELNITREEIESIYKEGVGAVIELVLRLLSIIRELEEEVQRVKEILFKDGHNSREPPSSDGLKKRVTTQSLCSQRTTKFPHRVLHDEL